MKITLCRQNNFFFSGYKLPVTVTNCLVTNKEKSELLSNNAAARVQSYIRKKPPVLYTVHTVIVNLQW